MAGQGPSWSAEILSTGPQAQEEAGHDAGAGGTRGLQRPPPPLWAGPQQQEPRVEAVALRVHLLQMPLPCTTAPLSPSGQSAHRLSPHCFRMPRHQLLPQSLAPHSLQLARPGFLRSQGSEAGGAWATWGQPQAPLCLPWGSSGKGQKTKMRSQGETRRERLVMWREAT